MTEPKHRKRTYLDVPADFIASYANAHEEFTEFRIKTVRDLVKTKPYYDPRPTIWQCVTWTQLQIMDTMIRTVDLEPSMGADQVRAFRRTARDINIPPREILAICPLPYIEEWQTRKSLQEQDITSLEKLARLSEPFILKLPHMSRRNLTRLIALLQFHGLHSRMTERDFIAYRAAKTTTPMPKKDEVIATLASYTNDTKKGEQLAQELYDIWHPARSSRVKTKA